MANVSVYNMEGNEVGTIELSDAIFGVEVNEHLVHLAVVQHLANMRQGTQKAKTRSEVSGGGRKPWRQKGTGHARQKKAALKSALTDSVANGKLIVLDELSLDAPKTKEFAKVLDNLKVEGKALVVLGDANENAARSANNIPTVRMYQTNELNVYDVMNARKVVLTKDAVAKIEEVYA